MPESEEEAEADDYSDANEEPEVQGDESEDYDDEEAPVNRNNNKKRARGNVHKFFDIAAEEEANEEPHIKRGQQIDREDTTMFYNKS